MSTRANDATRDSATRRTMNAVWEDALSAFRTAVESTQAEPGSRHVGVGEPRSRLSDIGPMWDAALDRLQTAAETSHHESRHERLDAPS